MLCVFVAETGDSMAVYVYCMPLYGTIVIILYIYLCYCWIGAMFTNSFIVWNKSHFLFFRSRSLFLFCPLLHLLLRTPQIQIKLNLLCGWIMNDFAEFWNSYNFLFQFAVHLFRFNEKQLATTSYKLFVYIFHLKCKRCCCHQSFLLMCCFWTLS